MRLRAASAAQDASASTRSSSADGWGTRTGARSATLKAATIANATRPEAIQNAR